MDGTVSDRLRFVLLSARTWWHDDLKAFYNFIGIEVSKSRFCTSSISKLYDIHQQPSQEDLFIEGESGE